MFNSKKTFVVVQPIVNKSETIGNNNYIELGSITRLVEANNKEEAIGKFIIQTENECKGCKQKLNPTCVELNEIEKLK